MYKLFAMDMDGTLLTTKRTISPKTLSVLHQAVQDGKHLVIATGRPVEGILSYAQELGIVQPGQYAICFNGAAVYELQPLRLVVGNSISGRDVKKLRLRAKQYAGVHCHGYAVQEGLLLEQDNPYTNIEITYNRIPFSYTDFAQTADEQQFHKFMFCGEKEVLDRVEQDIDDLRGQYTILRSTDNFLEFLNNKSSKGYALEELCKIINLDLAATVAFGDAQNDEHMLKSAGLGVVMGNGIQALRNDPSLRVTLSNDEDGVAVVIAEVL